ncbi:hypothetical protein EHI8A_003970 [Entamoeba histolytica HM-1:IMSS-B]|uniref:Ferric oxidoreductase domain-containing protein n=6 Tax=Entamoeba histolytica TaxID=5759 RepID=C4M1C2_ENTH1|nr:hypothetical protein EHI_170000 [Entamoeba histolytica HM-1:IMSS]EMD43677.1 Hypothetical protein EHI5A_016980 [Entamoeba histolytica KU27]EMH75515.1 hypothetical protein EHI8A_003970 [Entamoeba histolytica HM-1:IMSS-B]EMS16659.1 hypothetical protein KM1_017380 [Entamoeba histolytica HM-3:IMSS]ENY63491.1 hypothetical protein EHI7A_005700 [Entamoeba histolytica HM-1:IMSS-A]EAL50606.1 hypothetical protein EHI_170000 [Entamoeba histolytica HM-1:IMSS]|eukprot:XP_655991.1 hypothetical protein EHI_170000 [Entamoeba histolytica HM-1:IMSS]
MIRFITGDSVDNVTNPIVQTYPMKVKSIPFTLFTIFSNKYTLYRFLWFNVREYIFTFSLLIFIVLSMIYGIKDMPSWFDNIKSETGSIFFKIGSVFRRPLPILFCLLLLPLPKNNISLISIFGTTFQDILMLHKISGWLFGIFAIIHSCCDIIGCVLGGLKLSSASYKNGILCFGFIVILVLTVFIRRKFYNIFHKIHIICFCCIIPTYIYHIKAFTHDYYYYLFIPLSLYLFDILLRFLHFVFPAKIISKEVTKTGYVILRFKKNIFYNSTQFMDVLIPTISPWSFHPFSIVCSNFTQIMERKLSEHQKDSINNPLLSQENVPITISSPNSESHVTQEEPLIKRTNKRSHCSEICIVVAPFGGWTNKLKEANEETLKKIPMFVLNPVGRPICALGNARKIVLIGTGIGFAPMLGHLQALCIDGVHEVDVICVTRSNDLVIAFQEDLIVAKTRIIGTIENYCTREIEECPRLTDVVSFIEGRPSFSSIASRYTEMKDVLVLGWGSSMLTNEIKKAFRKVQGVHFTVYTENGKF